MKWTLRLSRELTADFFQLETFREEMFFIQSNLMSSMPRQGALLMISHQILMMAPDAIKPKEFLHFHQSF